MADEKISVAYGDTINGTEQGDRIDSYGARSQIFGGAGDDSLLSAGYLSTVHGGADADFVDVVGSYVQVFGDEGDDVIGIDCGFANVNIANVSLTGGEGSDLFWFRPSADKRIFASTITDFNAGDGDAILLSNAYDVNAFYLDAVRESDRSITLQDSSGLVRVNLQGAYHLDEITNGALEFGAGDFVWSTSIGEALYPIEAVADGLTKRNNVGYVSSAYVGDVRLEAVNNLLGDAAINVIDAVDDNVGGRMLAGDANDNQIFAGDHGNKMWGGIGGVDFLIGGAGDDTFFAGKAGDSHIFGCSENDLVVLWNVNPGDFSMTDWIEEELLDESFLDVTANDGSTIRIHCPNSAATTTFQLGDGSRWQYNHVDKNWQALEPDASDQLPNPLTSEAENDIDQPSTPLPSEAEDDTEQPSTPLPSEEDDNDTGRVLYGDENDNVIMAGDYGDTLWGGAGGYDLLYGGAGADVFRAGKGEGSVEIWGCAEDDLVDLWNIALEDIADISFASYEEYNLKSMLIALNDGNSIEVISETEVGSTTVQLSDGSKWQHNYSDGSWQLKE